MKKDMNNIVAYEYELIVNIYLGMGLLMNIENISKKIKNGDKPTRNSLLSLETMLQIIESRNGKKEKIVTTIQRRQNAVL